MWFSPQMGTGPDFLSCWAPALHLLSCPERCKAHPAAENGGEGKTAPTPGAMSQPEISRDRGRTPGLWRAGGPGTAGLLSPKAAQPCEVDWGWGLRTALPICRETHPRDLQNGRFWAWEKGEDTPAVQRPGRHQHPQVGARRTVSLKSVSLGHGLITSETSSPRAARPPPPTGSSRVSPRPRLGTEGGCLQPVPRAAPWPGAASGQSSAPGPVQHPAH